ncbi:receptor-interacting serine/threonine-protein kinase 4 isoform X1 [Halyomorpha halys]|uniref:receptor-interacting serine/threonine-protein kinase 4 isoform X1 n=1 Tax=Halyomorpha halys TaxID=286706 RepID=UPI0006D4CC82|nr:receptor-interacting serine/threonine-protein kinase 4-like [Halyomorpha halys]XP_014272665.1 receptor-interacting serine/threonine-protein kinase 4-like [Halyomorpha halys]
MEATIKFGVPSIGELRIAKMLFDYISSKLTNAMCQTICASVQNSYVTNAELTSAQCILLALLHSLQTGDVPFCAILLQLPIIDNLKSPFISVWLRDEFIFDELQVVKALSLAAQLAHTGCLNIPEHILRLLATLTTKYHVFEHCRKSGDIDTINLLMELHTPVSRGQQTEIDEISASMSALQSVSNHDIQNSGITTANDDTSVASSIEISLEREVTTEENVGRNEESASVKQSSEAAAGDTVFEGNNLENGASSSTDVCRMMTPKKSFIPSIASQYAGIGNSPSSEELDTMVGGFVVIEGENTSIERDTVSPMTRHESHRSSEEPNEDFIRVFRHQRRTKMQELHENIKKTGDLIPMIRSQPVVQVNLTPGDIAVIQNYVWSPGASHADLVMLATNKRDYMGNTLLHRAAEKGRWMDVRTLVKLRDMVDLRNDLCKTPAHLAAISGSVESLQILLDHGASLSATTEEGYTVLHEAAKHGHTEIVKWLLDRGAEIEARDRQGQTALHTAVIWCRYETVDLLLNQGAHINLRNVYGQTPLALAALSRGRKIRALLKSKGGIK